MNKITNLLLGAIVVLLMILGYSLSYNTQTTLGGSSTDTFDTTSVSTLIIATTTRTVVAESPFRKFVQIQNNNTAPIYCLLDGNTTAAASAVTSTLGKEVGFRIAPSPTSTAGSSVYEIRGYIGNINCTSTSTPIGVSSTITTSP